MTVTERKITDEKKIKIFILYLLEKLGREIDFSTLSEIILFDGSINYFFFASCLGELTDAGLVKMRLEGDAMADLEREKAEQRLTEELGEKESEEDVLRRLVAERRRQKDELYIITPLGQEVLATVSGEVLETAKAKLMRSSARLFAYNKNGSIISSHIEKHDEGCNVICAITEKKHPLMELSVYFDNLSEAENVSDSFDDRAEIIYRGVVALLTGEARYWS